MTAKKAAETAQDTQQQDTTDEETPLVGVFVAREPLAIDGVLAFNTGDLVPAGHVQRFGWRDQVRPYDESED